MNEETWMRCSPTAPEGPGDVEAVVQEAPVHNGRQQVFNAGAQEAGFTLLADWTHTRVSRPATARVRAHLPCVQQEQVRSGASGG